MAQKRQDKEGAFFNKQKEIPKRGGELFEPDITFRKAVDILR